MGILPLTDLNYIGSLLHESFLLPVFGLDRTGELSFSYTGSWQVSPMYASVEAMLAPLFQPTDSPEFPVLRTSDFLENFCSIVIQEGGLFQGELILGPVIYSKLPEILIEGLVNDYRKRAQHLEISAYYRELRVMSSSQFVQASRHAFYMLYRRQLDPTHLLRLNRMMAEASPQAEESVRSLAERRLNVEFHQDPSFEKQIWQCIKEGRTEQLRTLWRSLSQNEGIGVLSKNSQLRSQKNLAISGITLATRYAMEGGLPAETAFVMSDLYIQALEELASAKEVDDLLAKAVFDFTERVSRSNTAGYTKPVKQCLNHIFNHLYEEIPLSDLSELTGLHPKYVSTLFRQETGMTVSAYLQHARIEEAKNLLLFSERSLSDICALLNFHDQSYFTKVFKKQTGITPKQFRLQRS